MPIRVLFKCEFCDARPDDETQRALEAQLQELLFGTYLDADPGAGSSGTGADCMGGPATPAGTTGANSRRPDPRALRHDRPPPLGDGPAPGQGLPAGPPEGPQAPRARLGGPLQLRPHRLAVEEAAAIAACPKEMPPSLGGSSRGISTRRHPAVETLGRSLEQQPVLEDAARRAPTSSMPAALGLGGAAPSRSRPRRRCESGRRSSPTAASADASSLTAAHQLARVEQHHRPRPLHDRQGIGAALVEVGGRLELGRGLALVWTLGAQPADRGDRVEEAAHARRRRRCDSGPHELADLDPARARPPRRRGQRGSRGRSSPLAATSQAQAIRHGSLDRRGAARQPDRPQHPGALGSPSDPAERAARRPRSSRPGPYPVPS